MVMKIEKGKFYKSRNGQKWEVLTTERNDRWRVVAMDELGKIGCFDEKGNSYIGLCSHSDLIAEWTEPVEIPWSDYPTWCNWAAMDSDGEWYCYDSKPKASLSTWINEDFVNAIHPDYQPKNFTGDWTESLFERPQK
jgi:hypothetical protein